MGDDIPLIARILAVGDAFSAMTTTRPYRKALDVEEAFVRLGDAAGTQLDEESLVEVFIRRVESVPDAPLPITDGSPARWRQVGRSRRRSTSGPQASFPSSLPCSRRPCLWG